VWASAALGIAAAALLLAAAWREPQRRAWALVAITGVILYLTLRGLLPPATAERTQGEHWSWGGHLLALAGMLALGALLVRRTGITPREMGFARPSSVALAAGVMATAILLSYPLHVITAGWAEPVPASVWLFVATMPGLAEEVAFRGVLLAAAERAAPGARVIAGVPVSVGAALLTAVFVGLHSFGVGMLVSVLPGALLYLWLRLRTGSVLVPVVAHNLWNLTVLIANP
jgi:membrane protease YdiL (CAAX protease family)